MDAIFASLKVIFENIYRNIYHVNVSSSPFHLPAVGGDSSTIKLKISSWVDAGFHASVAAVRAFGLRRHVIYWAECARKKIVNVRAFLRWPQNGLTLLQYIQKL